MINKVFDPLRKKYVALTPEEQVRQCMISWLSTSKHYPLSLMASEYQIKFNKLSFRCDIVVFKRNLSPKIIIECKAPSVKLNKDVIDQVLRYNMILNVELIVITNGISTFAFKLNDRGYVPTNEIDDYKDE